VKDTQKFSGLQMSIYSNVFNFRKNNNFRPSTIYDCSSYHQRCHHSTEDYHTIYGKHR